MKFLPYSILMLTLFGGFTGCINNGITQKAENERANEEPTIEDSFNLKMEFQKQISLALNNWHQAAATANTDAFYGFMTKDCIYLGTDPSEKWYRDELKEWAAFAFERDTAWAFTPYNRGLYFAKDLSTAWFDEKLSTEKMGECRGSGVLVLTKNGWKLKHYNLSVTILNEKMDDFLEIKQ